MCWPLLPCFCGVFWRAFSSLNTIRLGFQQVPLARNCLAGLFMEPLFRTPRTIKGSQRVSSLKTSPLFPIFVPVFFSFPLPLENGGSHVIAVHAATKLFAHGTCRIPAWRNHTQARLCANLWASKCDWGIFSKYYIYIYHIYICIYSCI